MFQWSTATHSSRVGHYDGDSRISQYYQAERAEFEHHISDYLIVGVVALASVILILYPIWK